jgi:hypothetical protein
MRKRANHRLVKIHRSYTVEEVARLLGTHKNTVRTWVKVGLRTCDSIRPTLILGRHLAEFLQVRRRNNLSEKDMRIAMAQRVRKAPTLEQMKHVIQVMPHATEIQRRNRALMAFTLLTGHGTLPSLR